MIIKSFLHLQHFHLVRKHHSKTAAASALLLFVIGGTTLLIRSTEPASAATVSIALPALKQATLTNEDSQRVPETLAAPEAINAALPFATTPLKSAEPFVINGSDDDKRLALRCLSQAVYYEAGYEPIDGRRAVAQVVINRVRHPAFPKSVCGVVYEGAATGKCQFSFVCDGQISRPPQPAAWREAEAVARAALSGFVADEVGEATHYHADYVAPEWAPLLAKVAAIGQHIFYRWPGEWGDPAMFKGHYAGEPHDALTLRLARSSLALADISGKSADRESVVPHVAYEISSLLKNTPASGDEIADASSAAAAGALLKGVDSRSIAMAK